MTAQLPSRERLERVIQLDDIYDPELTKALARFALAAHEQEPVGDVVAWSHPQHPQQTCNIRWRRFDVAPGPLYTNPAPVPAVPECFERLLVHAQGIAMGVDWNKGTAATHHRDKLCQAVKDCAAMLNGSKS